MNAQTFYPHEIGAIRQAIETRGCVVVRNVLSGEEVSETKRLVYEWLGEQGIDAQNRDTWRMFSKDFFHMSHSIHGMMADGPNMFLKPVIFAKSRSGTIDFLSGLYGVTRRQLVIEHGGLFFRFPPELHEVKGEAYRGFRHHDDEWFHSDAVGLTPGEDLRSIIVVEDCNQEIDHTFVFLSGSHLHHDRYFSLIEHDEPGPYQLNADEVEWFAEQGCNKVRACASAGSMVIWHPKTIHATENPVQGRGVPRERVVIYGSLIPRACCDHKKRRADLEHHYRPLDGFDRGVIRMLTYA